jgi:hypothetical protein
MTCIAVLENLDELDCGDQEKRKREMLLETELKCLRIIYIYIYIHIKKRRIKGMSIKKGKD